MNWRESWFKAWNGAVNRSLEMEDHGKSTVGKSVRNSQTRTSCLHGPAKRNLPAKRETGYRGSKDEALDVGSGLLLKYIGAFQIGSSLRRLAARTECDIRGVGIR